ncbi:MAG: outer membrane protein assembly factor BamA [Deltaproteobacteria bacterium]|nr:outer membrane protein assembly factor BamA [Deltaproteobacteria bacterium]
MLCLATLAAGEARAAGREIAEIRVEGNKRVESDAVLANVKSAAGAAVDDKTVREDIRRIFDTGLFRDVRVSKEETPKGIVLVFEVDERATVSKVDIEGNDEIDKEDIEKVMDIKPFSVLDMKKIKKNAAKIQDLYVDKGFFLSEVTWRLKDLPENNETELTFVVSEHAKVMVKKITFLGNKNLPDADLLSVMETQEGGFFSFITSSGQYKEEAFQRDMLRIQQFYRDHGYIKVKVGTPLLALSPDKKYMYISVGVEEGEQYRVGKVDIKGDLDIKGDPAKLRDLLYSLMLTKPGEVFNVGQFFNKDLNRISDIYKDEGYAWVNINTPYEEHAKERLVDLVLEIQKGPKCYFERILVTGNVKTRDRVIRRELRIYETDQFTNAGIERSKARVNALGFFEKIEMTYRKGSADNLVVVVVEVKEKPTGTFQVGAGFSSVENFLAQAQIAQYNLFGRGQSLSLTAQVSSIRKLFDLSFVEPYFLDTEWTFAFDIYNTTWDYFEFLRSSTGGKLTFGHPILDNLKFYVTYNLETVSVESGTSIERQVRLKNIYESGLTSSLTYKLVFDTRNNRLFPSAGQYHTLSVETASRYLGSDNEFVRTFLLGRWYIPLPWSLVLKTNASMGWISAFGGTGIPISERFYVGGINSVRGFTLRSVSPTMRVARAGLEPGTDLFDFPFGGNKELILNLEFEYPIIDKVGIRGVFFADAGNAYSEDEWFFQDEKYRFALGLLYSWGFGFRWFSPIGPLRFEWGFPITRRPNPYIPGTYIDDTFKFEFTIGNFF